MNIAKKIRELRENVGENRTEFSKHTGIPVRTIEDWESGRRTPPEYIIGAAYSAGIHPTVDCISDGVRKNGKEGQEGLNPSKSTGLANITFVISRK